MWIIANGMVETETIPLSSFDAVPLEPTLSRWSQRSALKETARLHACCCPPFAFLHEHARFCHFIFSAMFEMEMYRVVQDTLMPNRVFRIVVC